MKSIVLILPYFGKFPDIFPAFIKSCSYNTTIDWIIYTDCDISAPPRNIKVINTSFKDFVGRFEKHFNFPISITEPYKLCDFKVSYGEVLQDDINNYDFWGYCDCDLIFGDIRKFVTPEILDSNNKLFTRGHLSLYHNDIVTNSFYRTSKKLNCQKIFNDKKSFAFDEWNGISKAWKESEKKYYDELCFDDIRPSYYLFYPTKLLAKTENGPYHGEQRDLSNMYKQMHNIVYEFNKGKLYRRFILEKTIVREEILYVHFQKRKMKVKCNKLTNKFVMVPPNRVTDYCDYYKFCDFYFTSEYNVYHRLLKLQIIIYNKLKHFAKCMKKHLVL